MRLYSRHPTSEGTHTEHTFGGIIRNENFCRIPTFFLSLGRTGGSVPVRAAISRRNERTQAGGVPEGGVRHLHHQQVGGQRGDPQPLVLGELHAAAGQRGEGPVHPPGDAPPQLRLAERRAGRPLPPLCEEHRLLHGEGGRYSSTSVVLLCSWQAFLICRVTTNVFARVFFFFVGVFFGLACTVRRVNHVSAAVRCFCTILPIPAANSKPIASAPFKDAPCMHFLALPWSPTKATRCVQARKKACILRLELPGGDVVPSLPPLPSFSHAGGLYHRPFVALFSSCAVSTRLAVLNGGLRKSNIKQHHG